MQGLEQPPMGACPYTQDHAYSQCCATNNTTTKRARKGSLRHCKWPGSQDARRRLNSRMPPRSAVTLRTSRSQGLNKAKIWIKALSVDKRFTYEGASEGPFG